MKKLLTPVALPHWSADLLLLIPRLVCGYLLTADFGAAKFGMPWSPPENGLGLFEVAYWFPNDVAAFGGLFQTFPAFFAWMGAFSEAVGGLFLMLGLFTRPFAFLNLCTMLTAAFFQQSGNGLWNMLPALGFAWVMLYTLVLGSGRFGVDALLVRQVPVARLQWLYLVPVLLCLGAGVQPTTKQQVTYQLDVSGIKDVASVGVRGGDQPLSWDQDLALQPLVKDSLYQATVTYKTGYRFTEVKFLINGEMELDGKDNRKIFFDKGGATLVRARYNQAP